MKQYFLSNHLGNTLAIISDKRFAGTTKNGVITSYVPDIVSATDYSSFGVSLLGRQLNTANVEYGFNGKWNEVETGYQNYGMRDYDARARRFTKVDPIYSNYPMLTPYQYCSNRPIDGKDIDGKEYGTIHLIVDVNSGINTGYYTPYDASQLNANGPKGRGIDYAVTTFSIDKNGKTTILSTYDPVFIKRNASVLGGYIQKEYGNYMGATSIYDADKNGNFTQKYNYITPAVDAVDYAAKLHDLAYDKLDSKGSSSLFNDWGTLKADENAINSWNDLLNNHPMGSADPYTHQRVTSEEREAAENASTLFTITTINKKNAISSWMKSNFKKETNGTNRDGRIQLFFEKFMHKDVNGNWRRNEGMWQKDDKKGYYIPLANSKN